MSTNQKLTNDTTTSTSSTGNKAGEQKPKRGGLDLSVTQIVGGALAAMTAAALGSPAERGRHGGRRCAGEHHRRCRWLALYGIDP